MMKLSTMKKVMDTLDHEWRSPLADQIVERWGCDAGTVKFFRASANFVFIFHKNEQRYFLRFNDSCERKLETIQSEIEIVNYLHNHSIHVAQPVKSLYHNDIEIIESGMGTFYTVVFKALNGKQYEIDEMNEEKFEIWGNALGKLHQTFKGMPEEYRLGRPSWKDHLNEVNGNIPIHEISVKKELEKIKEWAEGLTISEENFGVIHYDFELDNHRWKDNKVGILDFDDCANYWYIADIIYALREKGNILHEEPYFQSFIKGYCQETEIDPLLLQQLTWFLRLHNMVSFNSLLRSVDILESEDNPDWLKSLRKKLMVYINDYRASFEGGIE